ncbi:DUF485 domain-containing protein [Gallaecimonas sp. GXIMD4217]|uniref:DUF485 domain-containing protein n=1 Tax=Gallaecimonas sp. GXIMD4217 TaxID=3131927 RepID=UPI00311AD3B5
MTPCRYQEINQSPRFQAMVARRERYAWRLSALMLAIYFTFILLIAFEPALLARPLYQGSVITWGIPAGLVVILSAFVLTGLYVRKSNHEFDTENAAILEEQTP